MKDEISFYESLSWMVGVGVFVSMGQLLASKEVLTPRIIFGRALSTVGISVSSGALLLTFTDASPLALIGASAGLASLGTSFLERLVQKKLASLKDQHEQGY